MGNVEKSFLGKYNVAICNLVMQAFLDCVYFNVFKPVPWDQYCDPKRGLNFNIEKNSDNYFQTFSRSTVLQFLYKITMQASSNSEDSNLAKL